MQIILEIILLSLLSDAYIGRKLSFVASGNEKNELVNIRLYMYANYFGNNFDGQYAGYYLTNFFEIFL